jgi:hypothetical protein
MLPYSQEFRAKVLSMCDAGEGARAVALHFMVSESASHQTATSRHRANSVEDGRSS